MELVNAVAVESIVALEHWDSVWCRHGIMAWETSTSNWIWIRDYDDRDIYLTPYIMCFEACGREKNGQADLSA